MPVCLHGIVRVSMHPCASYIGIGASVSMCLCAPACRSVQKVIELLDDLPEILDHLVTTVVASFIVDMFLQVFEV